MTPRERRRPGSWVLRSPRVVYEITDGAVFGTVSRETPASPWIVRLPDESRRFPTFDLAELWFETQGFTIWETPERKTENTY